MIKTAVMNVVIYIHCVHLYLAEMRHDMNEVTRLREKIASLEKEMATLEVNLYHIKKGEEAWMRKYLL